MQTLKLNDIHPEVLLLKKIVNTMGANLNLTNRYTKQTESFIWKMQAKNKLDIDGISGPQTWGFLLRYIQANFAQGIDVSVWNGNLDWKKLIAAGIKFAFIKCTEGSNIIDARMKTNIKGAMEMGIPIGGYHFYRTHIAPKAQADLFLNCGFPFKEKNTFAPVIDVEWQDTDGHTNKTIYLERKRVANDLLQFVQEIKLKTGRWPLIYTQKSFWNDILGSPKGFENCALWVVDYDIKGLPAIPGNWQYWQFWQYACTTKLPGSGHVIDTNYFIGTAKDLAEFIKAENNR